MMASKELKTLDASFEHVGPHLIADLVESIRARASFKMCTVAGIAKAYRDI